MIDSTIVRAQDLEQAVAKEQTQAEKRDPELRRDRCQASRHPRRAAGASAADRITL